MRGIDVVRKKEIITGSRIHETDTGSTRVQVSLLTERIKHLTDHLKVHKKDFATRRGLLKLVGRRSALLKYLSSKDYDGYKELIAHLGIRK